MDYIVRNMKDLEKELIRIENLLNDELDAIAEMVLWDYEETGFSDTHYLVHADFAYETWYHLHSDINRLKSKLIEQITPDNKPIYDLLKRLIKCQIRVDQNLVHASRLLQNQEYLSSVKSINKDFGYSRPGINKRLIKLNEPVTEGFTTSLYNALSSGNYIACSLEDFIAHFSGKYEHPIKWLKAQNQLFYLISELFSKNYLKPEENLNREMLVIEHFSIGKDWNHNSVNSGFSNPLPNGYESWPIHTFLNLLKHIK